MQYKREAWQHSNEAKCQCMNRGPLCQWVSKASPNMYSFSLIYTLICVCIYIHTITYRKENSISSKLYMPRRSEGNP